MVAALRTAEAHLDVEPEQAARTLARLMTKISERYAQGRVGALLDANDLEEFQRRYETLRLLAAVVLVTAVALAAQALHWPAQIAVAGAVVASMLVFRRAAVAGLGAVAFLYPLMFPGK
ncbi:hypothetical protein ACFVJH_00130 [Streptomyces decoyicus]|uniref:hypothetical protein n=1 Tax=Streptomyces decoyicus TaxID=249567 RepID=UPI00363BFD29